MSVGEFAVLVLTSDDYRWAMSPFAYLFNTYWDCQQLVVCAGFQPPERELPRNFHFYSLAAESYPANRWSDGLITALRVLSAEYCVLLLEDYWLCRKVDTRGVGAALEYCQQHPEIVRFDLTADRLYAGGMVDVEACGCYDIIETPSTTPYQMSFQAALWRRDLLLSLLQPGKTPWEVEMYTTVPDTLRVVGTRQQPVRYANVLRGGDAHELHDLDRIAPEHLQHLVARGWI